MVKPIGRSRRGASTLGCLFSLLLTVVALYYGMNAGRVWWRYYELVDKMKTAARFAASTDDDQILRQLTADAADIGVPAEGRRFRIARTDAPRAITISTMYRESIELPFTVKVVTFRPSVTQRL